MYQAWHSSLHKCATGPPGGRLSGLRCLATGRRVLIISERTLAPAVAAAGQNRKMFVGRSGELAALEAAAAAARGGQPRWC